MKRIGIIGGLGPESTAEYYKEIINAFKNESNDLNYPEIIINSINMSQFLGLMKLKKYNEVTALLLEKIEALKLAGAEFVAISANTPHLLFDQLQELSTIPLLSIVEATCEEAVQQGLKRTGLFGTGFTMNASFYSYVFTKQGIEVVIPDKKDRELINNKLFDEIEVGTFNDSTRNQLIAIIEKMVHEQQIDALILGCTELPLILRDNYYAGIPMLDTTKIHVNAIVNYCRDLKYNQL
jgi:aspartate racemase